MFYFVYQFIKSYDKNLFKVMMKDTDEQSDEIHRAWSGRVPGAGPSVPVELACITPKYVDVLTSWKLSELGLWGFQEASSHRHDGH